VLPIGVLRWRIRNQAKTLVQSVGETHAWAQERSKEMEKEAEQQLLALEEDRKRVMNAHFAEQRNHAAQMDAELLAIAKESLASGAAWDDPVWESHKPPEKPSQCVRIGEFIVPLHDGSIRTPALLSFLGGKSLMIKASLQDKMVAMKAVQSLLLRIMLTVPPIRLKSLFIDPIGLGKNVAWFMNLRDYAEDFIGGRAWTEPSDIEKRLSDISVHMETVIQSYLRGQFETMEEYNEKAGEVAEAYRVVAALDYPTNYNEEASKRLASIVQSGPRCGVWAIIVYDPQQEQKYGFSLKEIETHCEVIEFQNGRAIWPTRFDSSTELVFDEPPAVDKCLKYIAMIGKAAADTSAVQVPFEKVHPVRDAWWTSSSARGLVAPFGRSGANRIQQYDVGHGMVQHALIAGRTGSGKSTLMHALIISLAMAYSPDELELYLVDFKRGIEFRDYATYRLPHARAIAVQSEREFAISILQGLDAEMERRRDLFAKAGTTDLPGYRQVQAGKPELPKVPRTLLLVDEFQEFFTTDDRLAQTATLLLDRVARQGRSFGIHMVLGSQTLAGAYSLARSTMEQMALRIALQCSEADSRLILSEDNPAARLLTRPGEGFYNAQSGLLEGKGNERFQTAFMTEDQRKGYLKEILDFADQEMPDRREPLVFEGTQAATIEAQQRHPLKDMINAPDFPRSSKTLSLFIGNPVSISQPTRATLTRAAGRNLMIVVKDEDVACGMLLTSLVSLFAQLRPSDARFYICDMTMASREGASFAQALSANMPHEIRPVTQRRLAEAVAEIANEVRTRVAEPDGVYPSIFLVIAGLSHARELRREDYPSLDPSATPSPSDDFAFIISEGPELGVHVIAVADSVSTMSTMLDRRGQGEFGVRIATQLPAQDSDTLLDSPLGATLQPFRAYLFDDDRIGVLEKFIPYGRPADDWIVSVGKALSKRLE
jgi:DNA segregation ATPase FtsK/SpoIIIE, S-DNA-T family